MRINLPFGAGSQFASFSGPGFSFCKIQVERAIGVILEVEPGTERVTVQRVVDKEIIAIVHRQRPEAIGWRRLALVEVHDVLLAAVVGLARRVFFGRWIDGILGSVGSQADGRNQGPLQIVGPVNPGLGRKISSRSPVFRLS